MVKADEAEGSGSDDDEPVIEEVENEEPDDSTQSLLDKIDKEKKGKSPAQKLLTAAKFKAEGNAAFKQGDLIAASDGYYTAVQWCKDLALKPEMYPDIGQSAEQHQEAKDLCESVYCNIALVHNKYASALPMDNAEREKALEEAIRLAGEALRINPNNVKAYHRRAATRTILTKGEKRSGKQLEFLAEARKDLTRAAEIEPQNREIRNELKTVADRIKALKKEELAADKRDFDFGKTFGALQHKEKDLLGDGSIKKLLTTEGNAEKWLNEDWLKPDAQTKCVAHIQATLISSGGDDGQASQVKGGSPTGLSFYLGDKDMHDGIDLAVRSMTPGETARYILAPLRLQATGGLVRRLPPLDDNAVSVWDITFEKYQAWTDLDRNGDRLQKIFDEGWGKFPEALSEVTVHWRVLGPDSAVLHSSRYTLNMQGGSMKHTEDEEKEPPTYVMGETCWEPLAMLLSSLRDGGVGELRLKTMPPLPKDDGGDKTSSAKLSQVMNQMSKKRGADDLRHCTVRAELSKVVQPLSGLEDSRWEGISSIVAERFRAQTLLDMGQEAAGLVRLNRTIAWAAGAHVEDAESASKEMAFARATLGWTLACRAAPILDSGDGVNSAQLAKANKDLAVAKEHCAWLEESAPNLPDTRLLRAKILVAQDDDFAGAHQHLREAERLAPDDKRVQDELKKVKIELYKEQLERSKVRVMEIRDELKRARNEVSADQIGELKRARGEAVGREETVVMLLLELQSMYIPWEAVMETRIGVEIKGCQESCGDAVKQLCGEVLASLKDQSKAQRPMWD